MTALMIRKLTTISLLALAAACGGTPPATQPGTTPTTPAAPTVPTASAPATDTPPAPTASAVPSTPPSTPPAPTVTPGYVRETHKVTMLSFEVPTSWKKEI